MLYVGETTRGLDGRGQTHLRSSSILVGRMYVNKELARLGPHRAIWVPVRCWGNQDVSKYERLLIEGQYIWMWGPSMNKAGTNGGNVGALERFGEALVIGRRRKARQLVKFRRQNTLKHFTISAEEGGS